MLTSYLEASRRCNAGGRCWRHFEIYHRIFRVILRPPDELSAASSSRPSARGGGGEVYWMSSARMRLARRAELISPKIGVREWRRGREENEKKKKEKTRAMHFSYGRKVRLLGVVILWYGCMCRPFNGRPSSTFRTHVWLKGFGRKAVSNPHSLNPQLATSI